MGALAALAVALLALTWALAAWRREVRGLEAQLTAANSVHDGLAQRAAALEREAARCQGLGASAVQRAEAAQARDTTLQGALDELARRLRPEVEAGEVQGSLEPQGLRVELAYAALLAPGTAQLSPRGAVAAAALAAAAAQLGRPHLEVGARGPGPRAPLPGRGRPAPKLDSWQEAMAPALQMARALEGARIEPSRLHVALPQPLSRGPAKLGGPHLEVRLVLAPEAAGPHAP